MKNDDVIKRYIKTALASFSFRMLMQGEDNESLEKEYSKLLTDFLLSEIKKVREECYEQMSEIIGENDKDEFWSDSVSDFIRNQLRAEQRSKLQALKDKDKREMITKVIEQANADQRAVVEGEKV